LLSSWRFRLRQQRALGNFTPAIYPPRKRQCRTVTSCGTATPANRCSLSSGRFRLRQQRALAKRVATDLKIWVKKAASHSQKGSFAQSILRRKERSIQHSCARKLLKKLQFLGSKGRKRMNRCLLSSGRFRLRQQRALRNGTLKFYCSGQKGSFAQSAKRQFRTVTKLLQWAKRQFRTVTKLSEAKLLPPFTRSEKAVSHSHFLA